jgi:hypothetical protein
VSDAAEMPVREAAGVARAHDQKVSVSGGDSQECVGIATDNGVLTVARLPAAAAESHQPTSCCSASARRTLYFQGTLRRGSV